VMVAINTKENGFEVIVEDTGVGIDKDIIDSLFLEEPIAPTPGTKGEKGTGIGFSICLKFIKDLKGQIKVESKLGQGTKVVIFIPNASLVTS
jgi:signal transduction histidine kinase